LDERWAGGIERKTWGQFEAIEERFESLQIRNFPNSVWKRSKIDDEFVAVLMSIPN
jgi:hypothetical protein